MNKTKIMGIGIGQAGDILLNEFVNRDKRITPLFINSAYDDMSGLSNFNYEKNAYVFPGENGTGRQRDKAKEFVKDHLKSLLDIFSRYPLQQVVYVFFSTDGGTGSGSAPRILQTLRKACPNKKINVVAVLPNADKSDEISLNNSKKCCEELAPLENILNDIKFIDNTKGKTYKEINQKAIDDIIMSLNLNGRNDEIGNIDDSDSMIFNTEKGYGFILSLDEATQTNKVSTVEAIDKAIKRSVFALPDSYECVNAGISIKEGQYDIDELESNFKISKHCYKTYNPKYNGIVLGGCSAPNEALEYIKLRLEEVKENNAKIDLKKKKMKVDSNKNTNTNKKSNKEEVKMTYTEEELDNLVDDLENLFD